MKLIFKVFMIYYCLISIDASSNNNYITEKEDKLSRRRLSFFSWLFGGKPTLDPIDEEPIEDVGKVVEVEEVEQVEEGAEISDIKEVFTAEESRDANLSEPEDQLSAESSREKIDESIVIDPTLDSALDPTLVAGKKVGLLQVHFEGNVGGICYPEIKKTTLLYC